MSILCRKTLQPGQRIRVLVVDDSVVIRRLLTHALEVDPILDVVGVAANGNIALNRISQVNPDVVTLDIEMPEMDGLAALRLIRKEHPYLRVIMVSTLTERGAAITLEALSLGADDYVAKVAAAGGLDQSLALLRAELVPKVKQFFVVPTGNTQPGEPAIEAVPPILGPSNIHSDRTPQVVGIGVSTGGPAALGHILPEFPANFPLPVLVVQHMPALFTRLLAERLNGTCQLAVHEARDGEVVEPGKILVAPGNFHMKAASNGGTVRIRLDQSPPLNSCRPAVDALFCSLAETYGGAVTGAVLTGMGQDGLQGVQRLKSLGAYIVAQDEPTSVVWGMPGAVVNAGLADSIVPMERVCSTIRWRLAGTQAKRDSALLTGKETR